MGRRSVLTSNDVIERFRNEDLSLVLHSRGQSLPRSFSGRPEYETLSFIDTAADSSKWVGIDVFQSSEDADVGVRAGDSPPDASGIRWAFIAPEHRGDEGGWTAAKVYENVALYWHPREKGTDARWHLFDAALTELARTIASDA